MRAESERSQAGVTRADLLKGAGALGLGLAFLSPAIGEETGATWAAEAKPVVVLGARGKTGRLIVKELLAQGKAVKAVSYSSFAFEPKEIEGTTGSLQYAQGDVTKIDSLSAALSGASAVVFASSASKKGGNAKEVDYLGVENVAKVCIQEKVPRLVIISSGAVSRPDSLGYKITNIFGGIMAFKLQGEDAVRSLYAQSAPAGVTYTIVRPGGLSNGEAAGVKALEVNQGDTIIGEISRADVADACVAALGAKDAENATFEVYEAKRRAPLQPEFPSVSGNEHRGGDWGAVLKGLKSDKELGIVPKA